jgi:hypothetical protein
LWYKLSVATAQCRAREALLIWPGPVLFLVVFFTEGKMLKRLVPIALLVCVLAPPVFAGTLRIAEGVITTQIVDRAPVDEIAGYPAQQGRLYCFTRIVGAQGETQVTHVWLYRDKEMARVTLPVRSASWRTYSSKQILPEWAGEWQVQVLDEAGQEIGVIPFTLL